MTALQNSTVSDLTGGLPPRQIIWLINHLGNHPDRENSLLILTEVQRIEAAKDDNPERIDELSRAISRLNKQTTP